jgi:hypothetical protein
VTDPLPDYKLDPPAEPVTVTCDACGGIGFHGCDQDCKPGCAGSHACVICSGTGRLALGIRGFDADAKYDAEREMRNGI